MIGAWSFIAQQLFESLLHGETTLKSWNRSTLVSRSQLSITDVSPVAVTPSEVEDPARSTVALPEVEAEQQESDQRVECEHQEPDQCEQQEPETQSAVELREVQSDQKDPESRSTVALPEVQGEHQESERVAVDVQPRQVECEHQEHDRSEQQEPRDAVRHCAKWHCDRGTARDLP